MKNYVLTLTDKCNKNCAYCYENGIRQNISLSNSMLLKQANRIISDNIEEPKVVGFFGGEPFLELSLIKQAVEIFKIYNINNPFPISIYFTTNGILLDNKDTINLLQYCKDSGLNPRVTISFDGVQNKVHNLEKNIKSLVEILSDDNVRINYTLCKTNTHDIVENYKLAESLRIKKIHYRPVHEDFIKDTSLITLYEDNMNQLFDYLSTADKPHELFPYIMDKRMWDMSKDEVFEYLYLPYRYIGCNIGLNKVTYSMDDTSYYCHRLQFYQNFIKDVKDSNNFMKENNGTFSYEGCETCTTLKHCGLCSILNEIYTGDRNNPHPSLCEFYKTVYELTKKFFSMHHTNYVGSGYKIWLKYFK